MSTTETERACQLIQRDIVAGDLRPGQKLKIVDLRSKYEIGASPLREALSRLSGQHLISVEGNRGFRVTDMSVTDAKDVGRVRLHLELECLKESVQNGGEEWEGHVVAAYHKLSRAEALPRSDPQRAFKIELRNAEFHEVLVSSCASPILLALREQVFACHERYRNLSRSLPSKERDTAAEHKAIFEAVLEGDATKLIELSRIHITQTTETVTEYLIGLCTDTERTLE